MGKSRFYINCLLLILLVTTIGLSSSAQQGFYVPKKGKIFFSGDTATIFSDVINEGKLGVGKKAVVRFRGRKWKNDKEASMPDEEGHGDSSMGKGGIVYFESDLGQQQLEAGYSQVTKTGAGFSNLYLNNFFGVELQNSSALIWNRLHFIRGKFYLRGNLLVMGNTNPGEITGYNADHFIVTGNTSSGGALIRKSINISNGIVVFPVGTNETAYAPTGVRSKTSRPDDYYVSVFDTVLSRVHSGLILNDESVNKVWNIGKLNRQRQDKTDIFLQHDIREEGSSFKSNRAASYISQYQLDVWSTKQQGSYPGEGLLTTGLTDKNYGLNSITVESISTSFYFTKFTGNLDSIQKTKVWLNGYRIDWSNVKLYWETKPEVNNRHFIVQRRIGADTLFHNIDTVQSKAVGGINMNSLFYDVSDPNDYRGISYYRLRMLDYAGNTSHSNVVPIGNKPGRSGALIWPNPDRGRFFAGIYGDTRIDRIMIYNELGQLIRSEKVNGRNIIEFNIRIPGAYMVTFLTQSGNFIETKKVLVPAVD